MGAGTRSSYSILWADKTFQHFPQPKHAKILKLQSPACSWPHILLRKGLLHAHTHTHTEQIPPQLRTCCLPGLLGHTSPPKGKGGTMLVSLRWISWKPLLEPSRLLPFPCGSCKVILWWLGMFTTVMQRRPEPRGGGRGGDNRTDLFLL